MSKLATAGFLTCLSALLYGLTFPPTGWTFASWFALTPLLVALRSVSLGRALFLAWLWCVAGACVAGSWFPRSVAEYFDQPMVVALLLFAGVFTVMAAPYILAFAYAYRLIARLPMPVIPLLAGAAWAAAELGRGRLLTGTPLFIGNPWGITGYAHADSLAFVQIVSVTGIYGVSFAVCAVNAALAELWVAAVARRRVNRPHLIALFVSLLPAIAFTAFGMASLKSGDPSKLAAAPTRVAVVQAYLPLGSQWRSDYYGRNLSTYVKLSRKALADPKAPELVFWPESAMTFFLEDDPRYRASIASWLRADQVELVAGAPRVEHGDEERYFNSVYSMGPDGAIRGRYDKEYLVPFAEYFPLDIDILRREFGRVRLFEPGRVTAPIPTRAGLAGILVCNESMLPEVAAARVAAGAAYLVNPSNDSWLDDPQYTEQQLDIARMRAIEQRRYLVRASTAGPSAIVDPWGRVIAQTEARTAGIALGEIRPVSQISVYGRVGDLFAVGCLGIVVAVLGGTWLWRRSGADRDPRSS